MQIRSKNEITAELKKSKESTYSMEAMAVILADKKQRREKKHLKFDCLALDRAGSKGDELAELLTNLQKNKHQFDDNTRFQVVYRSQNKLHWSVMDVKINRGQIELYLLDAANDLPKVLDAMTLIHQNCPEAIIRYSGGQIQNDSENCATFSLDMAYRFAKIPKLHETLAPLTNKKMAGQFKTYREYITYMINNHSELTDNLNYDDVMKAVNTMQYISINDFPAELGPIIRNMQSLKTLEKSFFSKNIPYMGNDSTLLKDYVKARTAMKALSPENSDDDYCEPTVKQQNVGIDRKKEKIRSKATSFLEGIDDSRYAEIVKNRNNLDALLDQPKENKVAKKDLPELKENAPKTLESDFQKLSFSQKQADKSTVQTPLGFFAQKQADKNGTNPVIDTQAGVKPFKI